MRLRTSTRWGIGVMAAFWTAMLLFVSVALFLRASSVLNVVDDANRQFEPITKMLIGVADYDQSNDEQERTSIEHSLNMLAEQTSQHRTPRQQRLIDEARRWTNGETTDRHALNEAARDLVFEVQSNIKPIQSRRTFQVYLAIVMGTLPLGFALFFIRYLLVRLVNPIEEVFHYVESRPVSDLLPRFVPLPAVDELDVIENAIQTLSESRRKYVAARHAHVPFGNQAAVEVLLERIKDPVWVLSPRGAILGANNAAIDVLASSKGQEVREELYGFIPYFAADFDNADTDAMSVGPWWDLELAPDGEAMICILNPDLTRGA